MGVLTPMAGPLIKWGIGTAAGGLASKIFGGTPAASQTALDTMGRSMQSGYDMSQTMSNLAGKSFNPVVDYWSRILSGNRGAAMSALAPEIARMGDQNTAEMKAASELMPRTGGRATMMQSMPFQNMQNVQSMFQSLRPTAAGQLGTLGGTLQANATNALNASTNAGRSIMDYQVEKAKADRALGGGLGAGLFDLLKGTNIKLPGGGAQKSV